MPGKRPLVEDLEALSEGQMDCFGPGSVSVFAFCSLSLLPPHCFLWRRGPPRVFRPLSAEQRGTVTHSDDRMMYMPVLNGAFHSLRLASSAGYTFNIGLGILLLDVCLFFSPVSLSHTHAHTHTHTHSLSLSFLSRTLTLSHTLLSLLSLSLSVILCHHPRTFFLFLFFAGRHLPERASR